MIRNKEDVEADKPVRLLGLILFPLWVPIKVVGAIFGALCQMLWDGFCEGREVVKMFSDAWRGPDKEEQ